MKYRSSIERVWLTVRAIFYLGNKVTCPLCNWHFRRFLPYGVGPRPNAECPFCHSLERHRLLWLYLKNRTNFTSDDLKVLHFAPEAITQKLFLAMPNLKYISGDFASPLSMFRTDITNIASKDNVFDIILCFHVLEHVVDDHKAMRELYRVLKPGGWGILQVPLDINREKTLEDPNVMLPEDRLRTYGQRDHVRIYGCDYQQRLEEAGFKVALDGYVRDLGDNLIKEYGLMKNEDIYLCRKPKFT